jgi:translation initiation factor 5B
LGVYIKEGKLKLQTPLACLVKSEFNESEKKVLEIGVVSSIEHNHVALTEAKQGTSVAISVISKDKFIYGKQFDNKVGDVYSKISRESIDVVKEFFSDEVTKGDYDLIQKLKKTFNIKDPKKKVANE